MKILHTITSLDPRYGGTIECIKQLAAATAFCGHETEVASLDSPSDTVVTSFPCRVQALGPGLSFYGFSARFVPWLRANAKRYDVIVINGIWQYHSLGTWRAIHNSTTPYVVYTHGMLDPWFKHTHPLKHAKKWLYWPWADYRVLRDASAVVFTTEEERISARDSFWLYRAREVVLPLGTTPPPETELQTSCVFARHPHLVGKRIALFLGRIHPKKGCDIIINAFASELARDPAWQLVFAGQDQIGWRDELERLTEDLAIASQVTWAGQVAGDEKWGLLRAAEVMLLPSHQENFGLVVVEALACSLPVLISNKVNIWREIQADMAGFAGDDSVAGMVGLIKDWLHLSRAEKRSMRTRARESFERRFEITAVGKRFIDTLTAITKTTNCER